MIYTLTVNPSIDYYIFSEKPLVEGINRPETSKFVAAGKGVNVSKVLANLGQINKCVILTGGFTGAFICEEISRLDNIEVININIEGQSRVNVKVRHNGKETDINAVGPKVTEENKKRLIDVFSGVNENDYVCFNGSIQKGMKETIIYLAKMIREKGGKVVLDVPNLTGEEIVECQPYLIKPNCEELQWLLHSEKDFPGIVDEAKGKLISKGINVMLSLGGDGSCFIGEEKVIKVGCPKVKAVDTVGAGDSLLAGFMFMLENKRSLEESLTFASATGSAAVLGSGLPDREMIDPLIEKVNLEIM